MLYRLAELPNEPDATNNKPHRNWACVGTESVIVSDEATQGYSAAKTAVMPSVEHQQERALDNHAKKSHQPTRQRERQMRGFNSSRHAQRLLSVFGVIASFFRPGRHLLAVWNYREIMRRRFAQGRDLVGRQALIGCPTLLITPLLTFAVNSGSKLTVP